MDLIYRKASVSDLDILVKSRIEVLRVANGLSGETDMSLVEQETAVYYKNCFIADEHVAYLVYYGEALVGCGGISFYKVMPTFCTPSGECAYIMNMYTKPEYRRKGVAIKTLDLLVNEARRRGVAKITLEATASGKPLYERYGFVPMNDEMIYPLV